MKIRQIKAFLAVVRTGGVRRAANELCLTQSTIAKSVSQLEQELGCPLFERTALGLRLNAAGRVQDGKNAVRLLLCKDERSAREIARLIDVNNRERKNLDHLATEEALEQIKQDPEAETKSSTIVFKESWNQGIIGIVASRLIETYYRPTIVFTTTANATAT